MRNTSRMGIGHGHNYKITDAQSFRLLRPRPILKQLALFCCAGLLVSLLMMSYGVDLSPGFF
jgi:hypothetical protein